MQPLLFEKKEQKICEIKFNNIKCCMIEEHDKKLSVRLRKRYTYRVWSYGKINSNDTFDLLKVSNLLFERSMVMSLV